MKINERYVICVSKKIFERYFGHGLDLRIRLFNVLVSVSGCFCAIIAAASLFTGAGLTGAAISLAASAGCFALLTIAGRGGHAGLCHILFISGAFFILFPLLFFRMGGYHGGIPAFLVFAVVFTMFMLEGVAAFVVFSLEMALYLGMYVFAYLNPGSVAAFPTEAGFLSSNIQDLFIVCLALGATMYAQTGVYRAQQRRLDEQNAVLSQANRAKTEFLANTSHEMRTPLTVISVNIQKVTAILEDAGIALKEPGAAELLADAQGEIMRMSRMVGGMLMLASLSENTKKSKADLTALLRSTGDMMLLMLQKRGNRLTAEISDGLTVFGDIDLISQAVVNLIQNANEHTVNGNITLKAGLAAGDGYGKAGLVVKVTVGDDGEGIQPDILPRVFERGVSGKNGGTGYGLFLCKTVVESHGGSIWIESEPEKGAAAHFTFPVYEGQYDGGKDA